MILMRRITKITSYTFYMMAITVIIGNNFLYAQHGGMHRRMQNSIEQNMRHQMMNMQSITDHQDVQHSDAIMSDQQYIMNNIQHPNGAMGFMGNMKDMSTNINGLLKRMNIMLKNEEMMKNADMLKNINGMIENMEELMNNYRSMVDHLEVGNKISKIEK